jgi:hypothetical protein
VDATGHQSLTTHIYDEDGDHLDPDTAFAVKPSAVRTVPPASAARGSRSSTASF